MEILEIFNKNIFINLSNKINYILVLPLWCNNNGDILYIINFISKNPTLLC